MQTQNGSTATCNLFIIEINSRNYSKLKTLIYAVEKASLGLGQLPKSMEEANSLTINSSFLSHVATSTDELSPLIDPVSQETSNDLFSDALDEQLDMIVRFYAQKEENLYQRIEQLLSTNEVDTCLPPKSKKQTRPRSLSESHSQNTTQDQDSLSRSMFVDNPEQRNEADTKQLKKQLVETYIELNNLRSNNAQNKINLEEYTDLNYSGFSKILKKYEKVTGFSLKRSYLAKVNNEYPFQPQTKESLSHHIEDITLHYSRITDITVEKAQLQLNSHLRDKLTWERNTIWKDMVQKERRQTTLVIEQDNELLAESFFAFHEHTINGYKLCFPMLSFQLVKFIAACLILYLACNLGIFPEVEQNNCFGILMFGSVLWSMEIIPLFVTSLLIPALVVLLKVQRELTRNEDGSFSYKRLDAKASTKKVK